MNECEEQEESKRALGLVKSSLLPENAMIWRQPRRCSVTTQPVVLARSSLSMGWPDAPPELIEAHHKALMAGPLTIAFGQSRGEVVAGEPQRLAITVFAAIEGLVTLSFDGKINGIPIEKHAEHCIQDIMLGLEPRANHRVNSPLSLDSCR